MSDGKDEEVAGYFGEGEDSGGDCKGRYREYDIGMGFPRA